jgi:hypothetical protein
VPERSVKHFVVQTRCSKLFGHVVVWYISDCAAARLGIGGFELQIQLTASRLMACLKVIFKPLSRSWNCFSQLARGRWRESLHAFGTDRSTSFLLALFELHHLKLMLGVVYVDKLV